MRIPVGKLSESGYGQRSGRKCKEKFENIYKYYKKTKDGKVGRREGKHYRFFAELEALYGSGNSTRASGAGGENGNSIFKGVKHGGSSFKEGTKEIAKEGANDRVGMFFAERPLDTDFDVNFSSETSEEYDEPGAVDYMNSRKRKRKLWSKRKLFEKLLRKFLEKQEELQRKFFEVLDRREQDCFIREEAWKKQETARLNREYDLRAQENALAVNRNATLVAYMQKIAGENLRFPNVGLPFSKSDAHRMNEEQEKDQSDSNNNRWPKPEVHALIRVRSELEPKFQDTGAKGSVWEEVAAGMTCLGYNRNGKRCKEKWENINKYFKKSKDSARKRSENSKTCQYFKQLDDLYRKGILVAQSGKEIKSGDPTDEPPDKLGSGSNENNTQTTTNAAELEIILPAAPNVEVVPVKELETDGVNTKNPFGDPKNVDPNGDTEKSYANDVLSLAVDADNGISADSLALAFDSLHGNEMFSSMENKSHKLEGLVKEILEMQQLSDDFEGRNEQEDATNEDSSQVRDLQACPEQTLPSTIDENNIHSFNVT